jgi:hypothetical protein
MARGEPKEIEVEPKTAALVLAGFFIILAVLCVLQYLKAKRTARSALEWPAADAIITKSDRAYWTVGNSGTAQFDTDITYAYDVQGQRYESSRITLAATEKTLANAEAKAARYPLGSEHKVRYNPDKPSQSLLELTPAGNGWLYLAGLFLALPALPVISVFVFF